MIFGSSVTKDPGKIIEVRNARCMKDIQRTVSDARVKYSAANQNNKVSKWLMKFSSRINYYGNVMDVLVQQHTEYVSLVWGAMKFVFVVSKMIAV